MNRYLGSLNRVIRLVRQGVSLQTTPSFTDHAAIADGASELFARIFGPDLAHTRLINGVQSLAKGAPLTLEIIFQIEPK